MKTFAFIAGFAPERCPTGAWDMQKFLLEAPKIEVRMSGPIKAVNDFVVKFANVNGSGSASANEMFARSLLRMGISPSLRVTSSRRTFRGLSHLV